MRFASIWAAAALATGVGFAGVEGALAQAQPGNENSWVKICGTNEQEGKQRCLVMQELRTPSGQFLASVAIRETPGEKRKSLLVSVPLGMLIQPGVNLQIDGGNPTQAKYTICASNACYAELAVDDSFISKLKAGGKLGVVTFNQQGRQVRFDLTLIGFTATYDGEGIDPNALQARNEELQRTLEAKAQAARDRLVAEQRRQVEQASE